MVPMMMVANDRTCILDLVGNGKEGGREGTYDEWYEDAFDRIFNQT